MNFVERKSSQLKQVSQSLVLRYYGEDYTAVAMFDLE